MFSFIKGKRFTLLLALTSLLVQQPYILSISEEQPYNEDLYDLEPGVESIDSNTGPIQLRSIPDDDNSEEEENGSIDDSPNSAPAVVRNRWFGEHKSEEMRRLMQQKRNIERKIRELKKYEQKQKKLNRKNRKNNKKQFKLQQRQQYERNKFNQKNRQLDEDGGGGGGGGGGDDDQNGGGEEEGGEGGDDDSGFGGGPRDRSGGEMAELEFESKLSAVGGQQHWRKWAMVGVVTVAVVVALATLSTVVGVLYLYHYDPECDRDHRNLFGWWRSRSGSGGAVDEHAERMPTSSSTTEAIAVHNSDSALF